MAVEIERKFLVDTHLLTLPDQGTRLVQGYLPTEGKTVVRVRIAGDKAHLTVKGENVGLSRLEFEYPIPYNDAEKMLTQLCVSATIEKTRYDIPFGNHGWEVDIFHGENSGLVVAEVELASESERVELPPWVTEEVTGDTQYYNSCLLLHPFSQWEK